MHTFLKYIKIATPSKEPSGYTKAEILSLKKYTKDPNTLASVQVQIDGSTLSGGEF